VATSAHFRREPPCTALSYADLRKLGITEIWHAQNVGYPDTLTYIGGDTSRRSMALDGVPKIPGYSRDEYPFACTAEGGAGAWVGHVPANQQSAQGGLISSFVRKYGIKSGDSFRVCIGK